MNNKNINKYFASDINERERACFEVGIKLGALYHILCGIPISSNKDIIKSIEKGIEASISCQPYVKKVKILLNQDKIIGDKKTEYAYDDISGEIINAEIDLEYESVKVKAKINWIDDLNYPLMYIEKIS
ncbi:MAG: dihydroneopterin aldolase [Promethearchaeota archaeon]|nr:MAG: dihydroneopterin aldolase [Candidatus Lokiarchaeota archaeon]